MKKLPAVPVPPAMLNYTAHIINCKRKINYEREHEYCCVMTDAASP